MISELPAFIEGEHWRELSPAQGRYRWRFTTMGPGIRVRVDLPLADTIEFRDHDGKLWARFDGSNLTVLPMYWWNGCSPKRHIPFFGWIGTPDCRGDMEGFGGNLLASAIHDVLRQFARTQHMPLTPWEIDVCFHDLLRLSKFPLAVPYFAAVRAAAKVWPGGQGGYSTIIKP